MHLGYLLPTREQTMEGRPEAGAALVREGIGELDALGTVFHRSWHLGLLAVIHARLGDPAGGLRVLEEAYDEIGRTEVRLVEAELRRIEGELRSRAGATGAEVEACFAAALAHALRIFLAALETLRQHERRERRCGRQQTAIGAQSQRQTFGQGDYPSAVRSAMA